MPVVVHDDVPFDPFAPGVTYQTVVGDAPITRSTTVYDACPFSRNPGRFKR